MSHQPIVHAARRTPHAARRTPHAAAVGWSVPLRTHGEVVRQAGWMDSAGVKAFFEQMSTQWDDMRSSFYYANVIDALAERASPGHLNSRVVDVGTGTGYRVD